MTLLLLLLHLFTQESLTESQDPRSAKFSQMWAMLLRVIPIK